MALSEVNHQSVEAEFFRQEGSVGHLVREVIQNSLDAALEPGRAPVIVSFRACPAESGLSPVDAAPWLSGLKRHLEAVPHGGASVLASRMAYLAIEDFGTRGLCGSPTAARPHELSDDEEDFFYFWRNIGISGKRTGRGSWGLGKAVYAASSQIRTFFGLTCRATDRTALLMGQCGLGIHERDRVQFDAYGYFGRFGQHGDENFAVPIRDAGVIQAFRRAFSLVRQNEPGLSLVIPWPTDDFAGADIADDLAVSVLSNYSYPVLGGNLEVRIESPRTSYNITAGTIDDVLDRVDWRGRGAANARVERIVETSRWALRETSVVRLTREETLKARWDEIHFPMSPTPDECRRHFNEEGRIAIEVPVLVRNEDKSNSEASFRVFLRREDASRPNIFAFIREGLSVSEQRGPQGAGYTGLVVVDRSPLAQLLRDSENPAHTKWLWNSERLKNNFIGGPDRVKFVASAPSELLRILMGPRTDVDVQLLADFFPDVDPKASVLVKDGPSTKGRKTKPALPAIAPRSQPLRLERNDTGFAIHRVPGVEPPAKELLVRVAYDCAGADPFKSWEVYDFDLASRAIACETRGGKVLERAGNSIRVEVQGEDFLLRVTGFETNRDIVVKHVWIHGDRE